MEKLGPYGSLLSVCEKDAAFTGGLGSASRFTVSANLTVAANGDMGSVRVELVDTAGFPIFCLACNKHGVSYGIHNFGAVDRQVAQHPFQNCQGWPCTFPSATQERQ